MKTLITYYSFSGHTEKAVSHIASKLRQSGAVDMQRLKPKPEIMSFAGQCREAFLRHRAELEPGINFDMSGYDMFVVATPVWAFAPAPAVNSFLDKITGVTAKRAAIIVTSGSGAGVGKCFSNIESVLKDKGASSVARINIKDTRCGDGPFVIAETEKALRCA